MRISIVSSLGLVFGGMVCLANEAHTPIWATREAPAHSIKVQFSGPLSTSFVVKPDADPASQFREEAAKALTSATITAAGTIIYLDWSQSHKIRNELLWWSIPRAGDIRGPHAEVTGRMLFKPLKELDQTTLIIPRGVSADTPVPVVIVESIRVRLAGPDGKPRGPQPDRELVTVEESTTEQTHSPEPADRPNASPEASPPG